MNFIIPILLLLHYKTIINNYYKNTTRARGPRGIFKVKATTVKRHVSQVHHNNIIKI